MKYREKDQIPIGVLIEAKSLNDDFSICKFCYNVEKNIKFDYKEGNIIYNHRYLKIVNNKLAEIKENIKINKNKSTKKKTKVREKKNYVLNINTKECHYSKQCEKLNNIEPKYIQGTRTTEQVILNNGFKFCKKCKSNMD